MTHGPPWEHLGGPALLLVAQHRPAIGRDAPPQARRHGPCHRGSVASWGHAAGTTEPHKREILQDGMGFRTLADMACDSRTQCNRNEVAVILRLPNTIGYSQGCRSLVSPERNRLLTLGCRGLAFPARFCCAGQTHRYWRQQVHRLFAACPHLRCRVLAKAPQPASFPAKEARNLMMTTASK